MSTSTRKVGAFSLVEVILALGITAISLLPIFALLPVGLHTSYAAIEQTASHDILASVIADLRATGPAFPGGAGATSVQFGINIPGNPGSSGPAVTLYFDTQGRVLPSAEGSRYRLTITFLPNADGPRMATLADLKITWPGVVDPSNALGSAETFIALDRN
jgi:uncharacterized protein (TIGR02598 family)